MKIKIIKPVNDTQEDKIIKPGETIERPEKRAKQFISAGVAEEVKEPKPKKKTKK